MTNFDFFFFDVARAFVLSLTATGLLWFVLRRFRHFSPNLHRLTWFGVLLLGLCVFRFPINVPVYEPISVPEPTVTAAETLPDVSVEPGIPSMESSFAVSVQQVKPVKALPGPALVLMIAWPSGVGLLLLHRMFLSVRLALKLSSLQRAGNSADETPWREMLRQFGISPEKIPILWTDNAGPALVRSWSGYRLLIPKTLWKEITDRQKTGILRHELCHYRHGDVWTEEFARFLAVLQWFNPAAWLALHKFGEATEWRCDDFSYGVDEAGPKDLIETLLSVHQSTESLGLYLSSFARLNVLHRINRLLETPKPKETSIMKKMTLFGLMLLFFGFGLLEINLVARQANGGESPAKPEQKAVEPEKAPAPKAVEDVKWVEIKGVVVAPNDEPLEGLVLRAIGLTEEGSNTCKGNCKKDGTFTMRLFPNCHYFIGVFDKENRFTAPYYELPVGTEKPQNDVTIFLEKGTPLELKFLDKETGKPIPGLRINLKRELKTKEKPTLRGSIMFDKLTDDQGRFLAKVLPGEYAYSVDFLLHDPEAIQEGIYTRKISVEKEKPFSLEVRIPPPFIGKVLHVDGTPAEGFYIYSPGKRLFVYTTDKDGLFRAGKPMENASIQITGPGDEQYFSWVKDELVPLKEFTFQLVKPVKVSGRLLDAETKEPLARRMICNWKRNPADPRLKAYLPDTKLTDKDGKFAFNLIPSLKYDLFVVHGRNEQYNGGPYYPRINLAELQPTADMDLGDLTVDPSKAVEDPDAGRTKEFTRVAKLVHRGEKKSMMKILVHKAAYDGLNYILKHQNEEPIASFALYVTKYEDLPQSQREELEKEIENHPEMNQALVLANDPILSSMPVAVATLRQLRGEEDSPWNVPANDPSRNGDWKKLPGMINPKILDNFLRGILDKTEEKPEALKPRS